MNLKYFFIILPMLLVGQAIAQQRNLIDPLATKETKALFNNLYKLSEKHTLFGHQHATEYGHGWSGDADRSDVKSVVGSHPAVIGIDLSGSISKYKLYKVVKKRPTPKS
jgi:mannan endo-1,4-beta-mannosidase